MDAYEALGLESTELFLDCIVGAPLHPEFGFAVIIRAGGT
jgi:hypothetical protein